MNSFAAPPLPRRRSRLVRWILFGAAFLGCALIVLVACVAVWRSRLRKEVDSRVAAIRAGGLPTNWEELNQWYPEVTASENAAFIYTNAVAHIRPNSVRHRAKHVLPRRSLPYTNDLPAVMRAAIETNRAALELAHQAAAFPRSRYPVDFRDGPSSPLPHLGGLKDLGSLLEYEALLKADAGESGDAARAVEAILAMARSLDREPCLVSQRSAAALRFIATLSLERVLCRTALSDTNLASLSQALAAAEAANDCLTGLIGERALSMEFMRLAQDDVRQMIRIANKNLPEEERTPLPQANPGSGWRFIGIFERDRAFFLRAMETHLQAAVTPPPASLDMTKELELIRAAARKGYYLMSGLFLPASNLPLKSADLQAGLRTAQTAVAVERWRTTHGGALPESLEALVPTFLPAVPRDPFDGQPLRLKGLPRGYVVYSIGSDRRDDGGLQQPPYRPRMKQEDRERFDILFTVER